MKILKKIKATWRWSTGYTLTIVSTTSITTVVHRIFHQPIITNKRITERSLRGQSASVLIFDEWAKLTPKQLKKIERIIPDETN